MRPGSYKSPAIKTFVTRCFILAIIFFLNLTYSQIFSSPESIAFDTLNNRYLISNVNTGNIVQITVGGDTSFFSTVLSRTLGMVIVENMLYVADYSGVVEFDLTTDQIITTTPIAGMDVLNDITADTSGYLYITDSGNGNIYRLKLSDYSYSTIVSGIYWPNGILYDEFNNRILFCAFGSNVPIRAINIENFSVTTVTTTSFTDLDGLTIDNDGNIYVSSWGSGSVYRYDNTLSLQPELISSGHDGPADIFFDRTNNILVVPNFNSNTVDFIEIVSAIDPAYPNRPPENYILLQNYPNPFNPTTIIRYSLPTQEFVSLKVYDILGNEIATLVDVEKPAGNYEIEFDASSLSGGIYLYKLTAHKFNAVKKMILIK